MIDTSKNKIHFFEKLSNINKKKYNNEIPYPHCVIDNILDTKRLDIAQFEFYKEDGTELLLEYESESSLVLENYTTEALDPAADNEDFNTDIDDILDFTERNPFGEVYR